VAVAAVVMDGARVWPLVVVAVLQGVEVETSNSHSSLPRNPATTITKEASQTSSGEEARAMVGARLETLRAIGGSPITTTIITINSRILTVRTWATST
jgi:hypothetical protein